MKWCFESFESFLSEIGERPSPQYTLDRIDSTKHYEPGNVRWADKFTQSLNQRLLRSTNKSGFRCVSQTSNGWSAGISHRGVHYNLGIHPTPELAALAHDQKAKELHGEAARLNFPPKKPSISAESMEMADGIKVIRYSDWPTRLQNFLIDRDQLPFKWSTNDCATFSCDAILAMTGIDLAVHYRDSYSTQLGSIRAIRRLTGGHTVEDAAAHSAAEHGLDEINPLSAKRGDWVLLHNQAHKILGVVALDGKNAVAVSEAGVIFLPLTCAVRAWRI